MNREIKDGKLYEYVIRNALCQYKEHDYRVLRDHKTYKIEQCRSCETTRYVWNDPEDKRRFMGE